MEDFRGEIVRFSPVALVVAGMAALTVNPKLDNLGMARTGKEWKEPE